MEMLALLLIVPILIPALFKIVRPGVLAWSEIAIMTVLSALIVVILFFAGRASQTTDVEIWNGKVTGKAQVRVSCEHSYTCNCTTDAKGNTTCQTCYEHSYDYDWRLSTTVGDININRINRQGTKEPPRFTKAQAGDPVAAERRFTNYIKGAEQSLYRDKGAIKTVLPIPPYPISVYDYHYLNRAIAVGLVVPDIAEWNKAIALALRDLGPAKQVNFIVVLAKTDDPNYAAALERAWLGGKKNDVVLVIGAPSYPEIAWVSVLSWTDRQDFKVHLRDAVAEIKTADPVRVVQEMAKETASTFQRKKMRDFEYLLSEIEPPTWVIVLAFVLSIGMNVGLGIFFLQRR